MSEYDGFVLLSFGGPEGPDDVMPFLRNVTRGRGIPDERLAAVAEHYQHFHGVSPINEHNRALMDALGKAFERRGIDLPIYWGNRNWKPYVADTVRHLRDDHVLDDVLPVEIPIPAIAEVQQALYRAAEMVSGETGDDLKRRLRTGTVVTTDDRNWELRYSRSALRFSLSRAVGVDMESATIAAQGYRFRVPYGTLLCVSDKPLHGDLKLPGQANRFYERAISEHMRIGIEACEQLRREGEKLHSRKLRAFDEPPFR